MKKVYLLFALISVVLLSACGGGDPTSVAEKFAKAYLIDHDVKEYTKFLEENEKRSLLDPSIAEYLKERQEKVKALKFKYTLDKQSSLINSSGASIYFNITSEVDPKYNQNVRVDLKEDLDGKWFVNYYTFPTRF